MSFEARDVEVSLEEARRPSARRFGQYWSGILISHSIGSLRLASSIKLAYESDAGGERRHRHLSFEARDVEVSLEEAAAMKVMRSSQTSDQ